MTRHELRRDEVQDLIRVKLEWVRGGLLHVADLLPEQPVSKLEQQAQALADLHAEVLRCYELAEKAGLTTEVNLI